MEKGKNIIIMEEYYDNGKIKFDGEFLYGKRNGKGKEYYKDQIKFEGEYKNGKVLSGIKYDDNGNIVQKYNNINGNGEENDFYNFRLMNPNLVKKKNGKEKEYNGKGKLIFEGEFLNDVRHGTGKEYYNEKLKFEGEYLYGWKIKGKFYINETLRYEGEYLFDRVYNGKGYDEDGNIIFEIKNGNGRVEEYYDNGNIKFEGEYLNGKKNGKGKEYNNKGIKEYEGDYLKGKKHGQGKEYNSYDGKLEFEGQFLNGEKNGHGKEFSYSGQLLFEGEYLNGKKFGHGIEYGYNGKVIYEGEYPKEKGKNKYSNSGNNYYFDFEYD